MIQEHKMKHTIKSTARFAISSALILLSSFLFFSCYFWFEQKVPMDTDLKVADFSDFFYYESDKVYLDSPEQVFASEGIYSGKIEVRWKEVQNASSYVIERAVSVPDSDGNIALPEDEDFEVLEKFVYGTKYVDTILENPGSDDSEYSYRYYYRVSAENIGKGYIASEFTDIHNPESKALGYLYSVPQNVVAWKGKSVSEIQIDWQPVEETAGYRIYRGVNERGTGMELLDTVSAGLTSYKDEISESEQGTEFYYTIVAVNSYGQESAQSSLAMGYSLKEGSPSAPENVRVENGFAESTKAIDIKWDEVSSPGKTVYYNVYRSTSESSVISLIKSRWTDTKLTDKSNLKPGVFYYYYVMTIAVDEATQEEAKSGFSDSGEDSENPAYGFLLSPPSIITVAEDNSLSEGEIYLKWKAALGSDIVSVPFAYNIYISSNVDESFTMLKQNVSVSPDEDGYLKINIKKYNFYKITTVNAKNLESDLSSVAAPHPASPKNVSASKNRILDSAWQANANGVYPVKITWDSPENETPYAYTVYRSTSAESGFKKVATVQDLFCIDSNSGAKAGEMYYYKVVSLNIQLQGSHSNNPSGDTNFECRGYGSLTCDQWFREYNKSIMHSQSKLTLMHKSNDMDKLGTETVSGDVGGSLTYTSKISGLGAEIKMPYQNYSDFYCGTDGTLYLGKDDSAYSALSQAEKSRCLEYFILNGSTDTKCNMSANGNMSNSVDCKGMYPGKVIYDNLKIVSGAAGGGYYLVTTCDMDGNVLLDSGQVSWQVGEEDTGYNRK